jgi:hypothetical protein
MFDGAATLVFRGIFRFAQNDNNHLIEVSSRARALDSLRSLGMTVLQMQALLVFIGILRFAQNDNNHLRKFRKFRCCRMGASLRTETLIHDQFSRP